MIMFNAFSYYDFNAGGVSNLSLFKKVLKNKFAFNMYSDVQIGEKYHEICETLECPDSGFKYKDFIDRFYNMNKFTWGQNDPSKREVRTDRTN